MNSHCTTIKKESDIRDSNLILYYFLSLFTFTFIEFNLLVVILFRFLLNLLLQYYFIFVIAFKKNCVPNKSIFFFSHFAPLLSLSSFFFYSFLCSVLQRKIKIRIIRVSSVENGLKEKCIFILTSKWIFLWKRYFPMPLLSFRKIPISSWFFIDDSQFIGQVQ